VFSVKEHPEEYGRWFLEEVDIQYKATRRHNPKEEYLDPHSRVGSLFHMCGSRINYAQNPLRTPWVRSSKRAYSANPLCPKLALYEIDGNTGTPPWKVNKTRNLRFFIFV